MTARPAIDGSPRRCVVTPADIVLATTAGAALALVDLRDPTRPSWSDAAAPALLLVALSMATLWPAPSVNSVHGPSALARLLLWVALWLAVPIVGLTYGLEPEATLLALPAWLMVGGAATLGVHVAPTNVFVVLGIAATMGVMRVVLGSSGEFVAREALALVLVGVGYVVVHWTLPVVRRQPVPLLAPRLPVMETGLLVGAGVWIYSFLVTGALDRIGQPVAGGSVLWGGGLGASDYLRLELVDRHSIDGMGVGASSAGVELGLVLPTGFIALLLLGLFAWPDSPAGQQRLSSDSSDTGVRLSSQDALMPIGLGLIAAVLLVTRMPLPWLNGWLMLTALFMASLGHDLFRWPARIQQPAAGITSRATVGVGFIALVVAMAQPILLSHTAASIRRGGAIPAWAEALPWTVPLRERCIRLREGAGSPHALDPASELKRLAERWTRLAPHDEYAWVERVRAVYVAEGAAAAEPIARQATARLPASPILARWLVRCLEESGRHAEAIAHIDAMRERFGLLHPTLSRWRETAASAS